MGTWTGTAMPRSSSLPGPKERSTSTPSNPRHGTTCLQETSARQKIQSKDKRDPQSTLNPQSTFSPQSNLIPQSLPRFHNPPRFDLHPTNILLNSTLNQT